MNELATFSDDFMSDSNNFMSDFDKMFNQFFIGNWDFSKLNKFGNSFPPYDVYSNGDKIYIEFALAGLTKDDIQITFSDNVLKVETIIKEKTQNENQYHHRGISRRYFSWSRTISPDMEIKEASMKNGILTIELNKTKKNNFKRIEIKD